MTAAIPRIYTMIDDRIDGQWNKYPPFSFLKHPHPDYFLSGEDIMFKYGFNVESYHVTTEDGYIN
jgi:hypothetical protein